MSSELRTRTMSEETPGAENGDQLIRLIDSNQSGDEISDHPIVVSSTNVESIAGLVPNDEEEEDKPNLEGGNDLLYSRKDNSSYESTNNYEISVSLKHIPERI